jgi:hypothetical protein
VANRLTRRLAVLLAVALLVGALAATAVSSAERVALPAQIQARLLAGDLGVAPRESTLAAADPTFRGGPITTSTGETVDVRVSDSVPAEVATPEAWAEFLTGLTHGSEISKLTTYIVSFDEMQEICGAQALGCYGQNQLVAPAETISDVSPEEIVRHEYGHHVAQNRNNSPWAAVDWGPKNWASVENVCAKVARREAYPGNESSNYALNPGEAWAETYRLMDERKAGITTATWQIVAPSFYPSEAALQAAEQDVLEPWTAQHTTLATHVFGRTKTTKVWWIPVVTPLDGDLRVSATVPNRGGTYDVALFGPDKKTFVNRAQWVGQRVKRLDGSVCGQRSLFVRVTEKGAPGRVRVSVTTP